MDEVEVREWLDKLVYNYKEYETMKNLTTDIRICGYENIQFFKGIEIVADVMGLELEQEMDDDHNLFLSFMYRGVKFLQVNRW